MGAGKLTAPSGAASALALMLLLAVAVTPNGAVPVSNYDSYGSGSRSSATTATTGSSSFTFHLPQANHNSFELATSLSAAGRSYGSGGATTAAITTNSYTTALTKNPDAIVYPDDITRDSYGNAAKPYVPLADGHAATDHTNGNIGFHTDVNSDKTHHHQVHEVVTPNGVDSVTFPLPSYAGGILSTGVSPPQLELQPPPLSSGNFNYPSVAASTPQLQPAVAPTANVYGGDQPPASLNEVASPLDKPVSKPTVNAVNSYAPQPIAEKPQVTASAGGTYTHGKFTGSFGGAPGVLGEQKEIGTAVKPTALPAAAKPVEAANYQPQYSPHASAPQVPQVNLSPPPVFTNNHDVPASPSSVVPTVSVASYAPVSNPHAIGSIASVQPKPDYTAHPVAPTSGSYTPAQNSGTYATGSTQPQNAPAVPSPQPISPIQPASYAPIHNTGSYASITDTYQQASPAIASQPANSGSYTPTQNTGSYAGSQPAHPAVVSQALNPPASSSVPTFASAGGNYATGNNYQPQAAGPGVSAPASPGGNYATGNNYQPQAADPTVSAPASPGGNYATGNNYQPQSAGPVVSAPASHTHQDHHPIAPANNSATGGISLADILGEQKQPGYGVVSSASASASAGSVAVQHAPAVPPTAPVHHVQQGTGGKYTGGFGGPPGVLSPYNTNVLAGAQAVHTDAHANAYAGPKTRY